LADENGMPDEIYIYHRMRRKDPGLAVAVQSAALALSAPFGAGFS
jgi:hypothetical protein